jgi:universal stress protein A
VSGAAGTLVFERILCPIDFSEASMRALTYALSLAQEADASLLLMHVVEALPLVSSDLYPHFDVVGYQQALMDSASERLRSSVPDEARVWCKPEEIVTTGKAYPEILRAARERQADLVVMGVHGRNPLDLMFFGSTTQHIVRQSRCPVLTLRS